MQIGVILHYELDRTERRDSIGDNYRTKPAAACSYFQAQHTLLYQRNGQKQAGT